MTLRARMGAFLGDSTITAIVGTRAYAVTGPHRPTLPYIVWTHVSGVPENTHDPKAGLWSHIVQVDCFAATDADAQAVLAAVQNVIENNHSEGAATVSNPGSDYDDELTIFRAHADFQIWNESA